MRVPSIGLASTLRSCRAGRFFEVGRPQEVSVGACFAGNRTGSQALEVATGLEPLARLRTLHRHLACSTGALTARRSTMSAAAAAAVAAPCSNDVLTVERIPVLSDNYVWLLHDNASGATAVVDPAEPGPVEAVLKARGWRLDAVLNTHHHWDHTGGNEALKAAHGCTVVGPAADAQRIPGIDVALADGDTWQFGSLEVRCIDTPGHTKGHITLYLPAAGAMFCGDTLFALGCGRMFEGTAPQFWASLDKLRALPPDTRVFCAHEYTASNARFATSIDPGNAVLAARVAAVDAARAQGLPTIPSTLAEELATNPFLRPGNAAIRAKLGLGASAPDHEVFGAIRRAKDKF